MNWIESSGGPLVLLPRSLRTEWKGVAGDDYEDACGEDDYLGVLRRKWGVAIVLGDEPFRTAVIQRADGPAIVRWMYAPTADQLLELAIHVDLDGRKPVETLHVQLLDEPYVILDSAAEIAGAETVEFRPPLGVRMIRTYVVRDDAKDVGVVLHAFAVSA
ncbi:MAG: hypothetical protein KF764_23615 [Labilithrix sp.]|nr:hypothetical protein [Labilithrix sp.]